MTYQGLGINFNLRGSVIVLEVMLRYCTAVLYYLDLLSEVVRVDIATLCNACLRHKHHTRLGVECLGI